MTANDKNSCLCYLSELIDEYNNTYQRFIGKKLLDADYHYLFVFITIFFLFKIIYKWKTYFIHYIFKQNKKKGK